MLNISNTSKELGMIDGKKLQGRVRIRVLDKDKKVVEDKTVTNNIVVGIRRPIIKLLSCALSGAENFAKLPYITTLKLGSMYQNPSDYKNVSVNDTDLFSPIEGSEKFLSVEPTISADGLRATFAFLYTSADTAINYTTDNPVAIREMGLYASDGTMVAHTEVGEWKKIAGVYLEVYWTIGYAADDSTEVKP